MNKVRYLKITLTVLITLGFLFNAKCLKTRYGTKARDIQHFDKGADKSVRWKTTNSVKKLINLKHKRSKVRLKKKLYDSRYGNFSLDVEHDRAQQKSRLSRRKISNTTASRDAILSTNRHYLKADPASKNIRISIVLPKSLSEDPCHTKQIIGTSLRKDCVFPTRQSPIASNDLPYTMYSYGTGYGQSVPSLFGYTLGTRTASYSSPYTSLGYLPYPRAPITSAQSSIPNIQLFPSTSLTSEGLAVTKKINDLTRAISQQESSLQHLTEKLSHNSHDGDIFDQIVTSNGENRDHGNKYSDESGCFYDNGDASQECRAHEYLTLSDLMFALDHVKKRYPHFYRKMIRDIECIFEKELDLGACKENKKRLKHSLLKKILRQLKMKPGRNKLKTVNGEQLISANDIPPGAIVEPPAPVPAIIPPGPVERLPGISGSTSSNKEREKEIDKEREEKGPGLERGDGVGLPTTIEPITTTEKNLQPVKGRPSKKPTKLPLLNPGLSGEEYPAVEDQLSSGSTFEISGGDPINNFKPGNAKRKNKPTKRSDILNDIRVTAYPTSSNMKL